MLFMFAARRIPHRGLMLNFTSSIFRMFYGPPLPPVPVQWSTVINLAVHRLQVHASFRTYKISVLVIELGLNVMNSFLSTHHTWCPQRDTGILLSGKPNLIA